MWITLKLLCWCTRIFASFRGRWRLMNWLKRRLIAIPRSELHCVATRFGFGIMVDPFEHVGMHIFVEGVYEPDCTRLFESLLRPGDCVLDVGANIGWFTLLASVLVAEKGQVHAFEPVPQIADCLTENVALNRRQNVTVHRTAALDRCGATQFNMVCGKNMGLSSIRDLGRTGVRAIEVATVTIDSLKETLPPVRLVKLDVEGAEHKALQGMKEVIDRDKPMILLELEDNFLQASGSSAAEVLRLLNHFGYKAFLLAGGGLRSIYADVPVEQSYVLAVHSREEFATGVQTIHMVK